MDVPPWESIKAIFGWLVAPVAGICTWYYQRNKAKQDAHEQRTHSLELTMTEIRTELKFISRDITEIKDQVLDVVTRIK